MSLFIMGPIPTMPPIWEMLLFCEFISSSRARKEAIFSTCPKKHFGCTKVEVVKTFIFIGLD